MMFIGKYENTMEYQNLKNDIDANQRRCPWWNGGARGVMVIVIGNGHGNTSSNTGPS